MERFANWAKLPGEKLGAVERKLFYGKELMMVRNEVQPTNYNQERSFFLLHRSHFFIISFTKISLLDYNKKVFFI